MSSNIFTFVKARLQIIDVVQEYTNLKKAGLYWKGTCPFHHEKTASFTVSPHKGIFYCFGCHSGGDVITFIAKIENCSPLEAVQHLANRYNMTLPEGGSAMPSDADTHEKERYFTLCKLSAQWFHAMLQRTPIVLRYLETRALTPQTQQAFDIGYFPGGLANVRSYIAFMKQHNFLLEELIQASLLLEGKTVVYSPFEERLIFPIKDHLGRYCGFGGRIFRENDTRAKYYNSRENQFFAKGSLLFGLDSAKKSIQQHGSVFLVEGYIDCITMVQHGYHNTVATLGTACTVEHLTLLARYASRLFVLYDGDKAGHEAMMRMAELCWQASIDPYVVRLGSGEDPASFLTKGGNLDNLIANATDILVFFVETLGSSFTMQPLREKIRLARKIIATIAHIDDPLKQDILLQRTSKILDVPLVSLQRELRVAQEKSTPVKDSQNPAEQAPDPEPAGDQRLEKKIFFAILNNIQLFNAKLGTCLTNYLPQPLGVILTKLERAQEANPSVSFAAFFETLTLDEQQLVSSLILAGEQEVSPQEFAHLVAQLQRKYWKRLAHTMKVRLANAKRDADQNTVEKIMREFLELKQLLLSKNLE